MITSQKAWKVQADRSIERGPGKPWGVLQTLPLTPGGGAGPVGEHVSHGKRPAQPGLETFPQSRSLEAHSCWPSITVRAGQEALPEALSGLLGSQPWARGVGFSLAGKGPNSQRSLCEPHPAFAPTAVSLAESHPQTPHTEAPTPRPQGGTAFGVGP